MNHVKPTPEELEAENKQILEKLDKEEATEKEVEEIPEEVSTDKEEVEETPKEEPTEKEVEETPEEKTYKKRYVDSTREAQALASKNRKLNEAIDTASTFDNPAEEDLKKEYTDWDLMSETEKKLATKAYVADKRFEVIHQVAQEGKDIVAWNEKVDSFIDDPKVLLQHTDLEGKTDEFKIFAIKESRRGADLDDLVGSFLFEVSKTRVSHKGEKMFEKGSGGENVKVAPRSNKISVEESDKLRETDYKKYKQYLKEGRIADVV